MPLREYVTMPFKHFQTDAFLQTFHFSVPDPEPDRNLLSLNGLHSMRATAGWPLGEKRQMFGAVSTFRA